jgi:hypothetical protein
MCRFDSPNLDPDLLATLLERFLAGEEMDGPLPDSSTIQKIVGRLETSQAIDSQRLIGLEFHLIPALGYDNEHCAKTLYDELLSNPASYIELLKLIFRPATQKVTSEVSDKDKAAAQIAHRVLMHCKRVPGGRPDGTIDEAAFSNFIERGRTLASQADRIRVFDVHIGEIFAYAPVGEDGIWPFKAARELLDRPELNHMRDGLRTGLYNKRGMVTKGYVEGGTQERQLATSYRKQAAALHQSHPLLAAVLDQLADHYDRYGRHEDVEARLRNEGD